MKRHTTAGIIVIGDEILKGSTRDTNSHFISKRLHSRGILVRKISVVSDEIQDIANEVRHFSSIFDVVLTTGGIGPTHDDRTFEGLSQAFDDEMEVNHELRAFVEMFILKTKMKGVNDTIERFCKIPKSMKLLWGSRPPEVQNDSDSLIFPTFQIRNVIAFPGVPRYCELTFNLVEDHLFPIGANFPFYSKAIYLNKSEVYLQKELRNIADGFSPAVSIGSYPVIGHNYFKTKLIVESTSHQKGELAHKELLSAFGDDVMHFDESPWVDAPKKLDEFLGRQSQKFQAKISDALKVIDEVLDQHGMENTSLSFNGGKDCTVLLHLLRVCVDRRFGREKSLHGFHILHSDEFPDVVQFSQEISPKYKLELRQLNGPIRGGLAQLKADQPNVVAVLMGSRFTDPNGRYMNSKCEWTDADWPHLLRVCPVLDWSYSEIWAAIRGLCIPYCSLYDEGYTSLGEKSKTHPNPALKISGKENKYRAAYYLQDEHLERCSRDGSSTNGPTT
ncbi:putative molybdopterin binding domain-containing protein [Ditylenchus destructor]|nr:putative molybdopterin binding domain-containing protein [Ditylenchus destructor]